VLARRVKLSEVRGETLILRVLVHARQLRRCTGDRRAEPACLIVDGCMSKQIDRE
jgi:hypothetical protein